MIKMFEEYTVYDPNHSYSHTSIMQKNMRELIHEIWSQVIPIQCPHCKGKSNSFRKDGYTKIFMRPLSEKNRNLMKQQERIGKES